MNVDAAVENYEIVDSDIRKPYSLIHGMNNLHISPIDRKRAPSFKNIKHILRTIWAFR